MPNTISVHITPEGYANVRTIMGDSRLKNFGAFEWVTEALRLMEIEANIATPIAPSDPRIIDVFVMLRNFEVDSDKRVVDITFDLDEPDIEDGAKLLLSLYTDLLEDTNGRLISAVKNTDEPVAEDSTGGSTGGSTPNVKGAPVGKKELNLAGISIAAASAIGLIALARKIHKL